MKNPLILPELREYIAEGNVEGLQNLCESVPPAIVAELISGLEPREVWEVVRHSPPLLRAEIISQLEEDEQAALLTDISPKEAASLVDDMPADDRVDLLKRVSDEVRDALMPLLPWAEQQDIIKLSAYPETTAGSIMTSDHATLPADTTAAHAIELLRRAAPRKETIYYAYVVDRHRKLQGFVSLRKLILAEPDALVQDIMNTNILFIHADDEREEAFRIMQRFDLFALPVVNAESQLIGIITFDDAMDVGEEEATQDFHKMGTVGLLTGGIKNASPWLLYRARLPWLVALVFMNVLSGAGIAYFEGTIEAVVALVFFLPLLIASGGNAGSQASTLMVRAMATGDVTKGDWFRLVLKEVGVALCLGLTMALAVSSIAAVRAPDVMVPVAMSMVGTVAFGSLLGISLPFVLERFKQDPATASAPLITSLADIGGVMIYFTIATWYLGINVA